MTAIRTEIVKIFLITFILFLFIISVKRTPTNEHMTIEQPDVSSENTIQNDSARRRNVKKTIFKEFIKQVRNITVFDKSMITEEQEPDKPDTNLLEYLSNVPNTELTTNSNMGLFEMLLFLENQIAKATENNEKCNKIKHAYEHKKATYEQYAKGLELCFEVEKPFPPERIGETYDILFDLLFENVLHTYQILKIGYYRNLLDTAQVTDNYEFVQDIQIGELFDFTIFTDVSHPDHEPFKETFKKYLNNTVKTQLSILQMKLNARHLEHNLLLTQRSNEQQPHVEDIDIDFSGTIDYRNIIL